MATINYVIRKGNRQDNICKLVIRITHKRKSKYYPFICNHQNVYLTEKEYQSIGHSRNAKMVAITKSINDHNERINAILSELDQFTFDAFEKRFFSGSTLEQCFNDKIKELIDLKKYGSASNYTGAMKSFLKYKVVNIDQVDQEYIAGYLKSRKSYPAPYLRMLRHICKRNNNSVFDSIKIKSKTKIKYPLNKSEVKLLINYTSEHIAKTRAVDFWLMSYYGGGMNTKDWVFLKHSELKDDMIIKSRSKTGVPIIVPINKPLMKLIDKHKTFLNGDLVFSIVEHGLTSKQAYTSYNTFLSNVRRALNKVRKETGIQKKITPYVSRHTHANTLLNKNVSIEHIKESLGLNDLSSAQVYVGSFDISNRKKISALFEEE